MQAVLAGLLSCKNTRIVAILRILV